MEYKNGLMVQHLQANGKIITLMERGNLLTLMVTTMKVNGKIIKPMEKESIIELMVAIMMVIGLMINHMVMVLKNGEMEISTKDLLSQVKKKEKVPTVGQIIHCIMVNGKKEKLMVMDSIGISMEEFIKGNGKTT